CFCDLHQTRILTHVFDAGHDVSRTVTHIFAVRPFLDCCNIRPAFSIRDSVEEVLWRHANGSDRSRARDRDAGRIGHQPDRATILDHWDEVHVTRELLEHCANTTWSVCVCSDTRDDAVVHVLRPVDIGHARTVTGRAWDFLDARHVDLKMSNVG